MARSRAGNEAHATVGGISVDKTAPALSGAPTAQANEAGWYRDVVAVHWSCDDNLSGVASDCPANQTITGEGDNLAATATIQDKAGNATTSTVGGVRIDRTAP